MNAVLRLAPLVLAVVPLLGACGQGEQKQAAPPPPAVTVAKPVKQTVTDYDEYVGRFVAVDMVEIRARELARERKKPPTDRSRIGHQLGIGSHTDGSWANSTRCTSSSCTRATQAGGSGASSDPDLRMRQANAARP